LAERVARPKNLFPGGAKQLNTMDESRLAYSCPSRRPIFSFTHARTSWALSIQDRLDSLSITLISLILIHVPVGDWKGVRIIKNLVSQVLSALIAEIKRSLEISWQRLYVFGK
jgi:hypothetical protein